MAREINRLSSRKVSAISEPGRHGDGGGLYLVVDPKGGSKRWVALYRFDGRRREIGFGALNSVPLARARELAAEVRQKVADGVDPIEERERTPTSGAPRPTTFGEVATTYMADREATWSNAVHRRQWRQTLEVQSADIWQKAVAAITTEDVLAIVRPMWQAKPETASRIRGRIERVLDAARAAGHVSGPNVARWRGHLDAILPRPKKLIRGHHAAMGYTEIPTFVRDLSHEKGVSAVIMRFIILTAARSGEVRKMVWGEVDLASATWIVPAARMKGKREHRVPLSAPALEMLATARARNLNGGDLVFPGSQGKPMTDMACKMLLRRMKRGDLTTHGFRSTFRDWAAEETDHSREVIEAALAHLVGDDTERAYRRGDALAKRRALMDHWAVFLSS